MHPLMSHFVDSAAMALAFGWLVKGRVQYDTRSGKMKYDDESKLSSLRTSDRRGDEWNGVERETSTASIIVEGRE